MTTIITTTFILLLATGIFVCGYLLRENRKQSSGFLMLTSFLLVLLFGLQVLISPVVYAAGTVINETETHSYVYGSDLTGEHWDPSAGTQPNCTNSTDPACAYILNVNATSTTTETIIYEEDVPVVNDYLGVLFVLIGLFGVLETTSRMYKERTDKSSEFNPGRGE